MEFELEEIAFVLGDALDLVGNNHIHHGLRVAYLASEMGRRLGWSDKMLEDLTVSGILHDFGLSSSQEFQTATTITEEQWTTRPLRSHAHRGWLLLSGFYPFSHLAPVVLHHHTPWEELLNHQELPGLTTALLANTLFLADRAEILISKYPELTLLAHTGEVGEAISRHSGTVFSPELVEVFNEVAANEAYWLYLEPRYVKERIRRWIHNRKQPLDLPQVRQLARLFGDVVDSKSPFTAQHSLGVGRLARFLGETMGLPQRQVDFLEIAGFLHDIGKLRVPDSILDKPGPLSQTEQAVIRRHSFDTYQILNSVKGFWAISEWAAFHHETPIGTGYPFRIGAPLLCLEALIIGVSDIFQALAQARPYRPALPRAEILSLMVKMGRENRISGEVVAVVERHMDVCYAKAVGC